MSALGHSLQTHSAPVPINVRYTSDSDHSRHEYELTRSAICRHSADDDDHPNSTFTTGLKWNLRKSMPH
jgi:hypothetical protein